MSKARDDVLHFLHLLIQLIVVIYDDSAAAAINTYVSLIMCNGFNLLK